MNTSGPDSFWEPLLYHNGDPFRGALLKIERAERHLQELAAASRIIDKRHVNFLVGAKPDKGQVEIITNPVQALPLQFAVTAGDAIHNLRSAFDHIAYALTVPPIGAGKPDGAYFPTGTNLEEFIKARDGWAPSKCKRRQGKMEGAHPEGLRIINELEPYDGGKHSLRALHNLDVLDKHKLLIPAVSHLEIHRLTVKVAGTEYRLTGADFQAGTAYINHPGVTMTDRIELYGEFQAPLTVVFGQGEGLDGQPLVETLLKMADVGKNVIDQCRALFPGHVAAAQRSRGQKG